MPTKPNVGKQDTIAAIAAALDGTGTDGAAAVPMKSESKDATALLEQLSKLAKLHADGALSDEEFATLKAKVIFEKGSVDKEIRQGASVIKTPEYPPSLVLPQTEGEKKNRALALGGAILISGIVIWFLFAALSNGVSFNNMNLDCADTAVQNKVIELVGSIGDTINAFAKPGTPRSRVPQTKLTLTNIRMSARNGDTGAITCVASITGLVTMGSMSIPTPIEYTVEHNSDGGKFVTLH